MKSIQTEVIITSIRSKVDRSAGFSASTPELTDEEFSIFRSLQNVNLKATFIPTDFKTEKIKVEEKLDGKTPSQMLRSILFVYWKALKDQNKKVDEDFECFYRIYMEKFKDAIRLKLEDLQF